LAHMDFPNPTVGKNWTASIANELKIEPDGPTAALFGSHDIRCRFEHNTLLCFIRVAADADRPFHRLPADFSARFILTATDTLVAKMGLPSSFGGDHTHHVRVKLKATASSTRLNASTLTTVMSAIPELVFHPGYADRPNQWEKRPIAITGCLAVLDVVTEGNGKNRLFKQEALQSLNYTAANGNADQHLYRIILKD